MNDSRQELFLSLLEEVSWGLGTSVARSLSPCLPHALPEAAQVGSRRVINTLNYLCFTDGVVTVNFRHPRFPKGLLTLKATLKSCNKERFECVWKDRRLVPEKLRDYELMHVYLNDGKSLMVLRSVVQHIDGESMVMDLTHFQCCEVKCRTHWRFDVPGMEVEFLQSGLVFPGRLVDFSSLAFRVVLTAGESSFKHINRQAPGVVLLRSGSEVIFSGDCRILRESAGTAEAEFVLEPVQTSICRFQAKSQRSPRARLKPSPQVVFEHPITKSTVTLKVDDIAGSGFSVEEAGDRAVLMPGLIVPEAALRFAPDVTIPCRIQVVYSRRETNEQGESIVRSGVAFIGMRGKEQMMLSGLLHPAADGQVYVCSVVDMDALWRFFFDTGFVYPDKFTAVAKQKENFKETYRRLYMESPEIARHFIHQDKGQILGHIAMVRFYENTWLFHHHAARERFIRKAGLMVLSHIARYVNDFYNLPETRLDFVLCYFQPNNRFPVRVFGGFLERVGDLKRCSADKFFYFTVPRQFDRFEPSEGYVLERSTAADLVELGTYYEQASGGLTLRALDLTPDVMGEEDVGALYERLGFLRARRLFSLRQYGELRALFMTSHSDVGLNMSSLTNCIHAFVLDHGGLAKEQFLKALASVTALFRESVVSVLLYPDHCAEAWELQAEKFYNLWVMDTRCTVHFVTFLDALTSRRLTG